jgi:arsenate reductase
MSKTRVLFLCVHNAARSQMAEALLNRFYGNEFEAESAGVEPTPLNPLSIQAMNEIGIDISNNKAKEVFDLYKQGKMYNYVISVCDDLNNEKCPIFPGVIARLNFPFPNPANFDGNEESKLIRVREIRDAIKNRLDEFVKELDKNL